MGIVETTFKRDAYPHGRVPSLVFFDCVGGGAVKLPALGYFNKQDLYLDDLIVLVVSEGRFDESAINTLRGYHFYNATLKVRHNRRHVQSHSRRHVQARHTDAAYQLHRNRLIVVHNKTDAIITGEARTPAYRAQPLEAVKAHVRDTLVANLREQCMRVLSDQQMRLDEEPEVRYRRRHLWLSGMRRRIGRTRHLQIYLVSSYLMDGSEDYAQYEMDEAALLARIFATLIEAAVGAQLPVGFNARTWAQDKR